ncbi:MAG: cytochrome c biogenesis protein CcdA [Deltaproteobacteria bacterium]|jgi:cytochrome c-type biogenesis protein|nr:cytochrome c biogenesis protein CcdA [Deltaproteobacteria bacterium]
MLILGNVDFGAAFLAGLALFFTPCSLPLIPAWLATLTGRGPAEILGSSAPSGRVRREFLFSTLFFVLGFSLVFTLMGAAASYLGDFLFRQKDFLRYLGALTLFFFSLILLGVISPQKYLGARGLKIAWRRAGFAGAFVVGVAFAAGWTPCGGPILASLLALAATRESVARGAELLFIFSLGLALPFLVFSLFLGRILPYLKKIGRYGVWLNRALGLLVLALAALLFLDKIRLITPDA